MSNTKSPLLVKKDEAKKGVLWHELANKRIIKQHGGFDIPEGDRHAVHKFVSPVHFQEHSSEETQEVLSDLEKEIQQLKARERQPVQPSTPPDDFKEFLGNNQNTNYSDKDNEQR